MRWSDDVYQNLANAIIIQAAKDYKLIIRMLNKNPQHCRALHEKKKLEDFFLSEYFSTLTKINGTKLLTRLQEE